MNISAHIDECCDDFDEGADTWEPPSRWQLLFGNEKTSSHAKIDTTVTCTSNFYHIYAHALFFLF